MKQTVAVIGLGNMGGQFARALAKQDSLSVIGIDPNQEKQSPFRKMMETATSVDDLPDTVDAVILAIKPQQLEGLIAEHSDLPKMLSGIPIISMLAGTTVDRLRSFFPDSQLIRIMPNLAVGTGSGIVLMYAPSDSNNSITPTTLRQWFAPMGTIYESQSEDQLDQLTAIFGSGPAYLYLLGELFSAQAQSYGVSVDEAEPLVQQLIEGSIAYAKDSDLPLAQLRQNVTSKGGVTEAVLASWQENKLSEIISTGLTAGYQRAQQLSR